MCVDFSNLNKVSLKYNYPSPKMDQILQRVVGSERISMKDVFFEYNQVKVLPEDQEKNHFHHIMGYFHVCEDAIWVYECWSYFPTCHGYRFCRRKGKNYGDIHG